MTLSIDNKIDPLSVINQGRQLDICPFHFVRISFTGDQKAIKAWVWGNLADRFFLNKNIAAFENPAEASMFAMIKDQFTDYKTTY